MVINDITSNDIIRFSSTFTCEVWGLAIKISECKATISGLDLIWEISYELFESYKVLTFS